MTIEQLYEKVNIGKMVKKGWLISEGRGRGTRYRLKSKNQAGGQAENQGGQAGGQVRNQGGQAGGQAEKSLEFTISESKILYALLGGDKSAKELKQLLSKDSSLSGAFKEKLIGLRDKGVIDYTITDKPTSPKQKYKLTQLGQDLLKNKDGENI